MKNKTFYQENSKEIAKRTFLDYGLKESSAKVYARALRSFCRFAKVSDPYALNELGIDIIEALMQKWISQNIFETASREEINKSEMLIAYSQQIAELDKDKLEALRQAFRKGTLTVEGLQVELGKMTRQALDKTIEAKFEQLYLKMNNKYNNH